MLAKMEQENTDQLAMQQTWVNLACDYRTDSKQANKRMSIVCWVMAAIIAFMAAAGLYFYDRQQDKFMGQVNDLTTKMEKQQTAFLEFLNQYDFETETVQQDGEGYNYFNRDNSVGGDLNNGTEDSNSEANP